VCGTGPSACIHREKNQALHLLVGYCGKGERWWAFYEKKRIHIH